MTDEERAALKAEITAELGLELGEHYFTKKQVADLVVAAVEKATLELSERIDDLETVFIIDRAIQRTRSDDPQRFFALGALGAKFVKRIKDRFAASFDSDAYERLSDEQKKNLSAARTLLGLDEPTDTSRGK